MDENNNNEIKETQQEEIHEGNKDIKKESVFLKYVLIVLSVFFGTFFAVYFVVDMSMHKLGFTPFLVTMNQMEKMLDKESSYLEKNSPAPVKIEEKKDKYIVTVNLKSFDNNPENIDVEINENGIKISGEFEKENNGKSQATSFYQNVMFPNKTDENNVKKEHKGNKLIITVPILKK